MHMLFFFVDKMIDPNERVIATVKCVSDILYKCLYGLFVYTVYMYFYTVYICFCVYMCVYRLYLCVCVY